MRRRKLLVLLAGLAVVVAAGAVVLLHAEPRHDFTRQDFKRLRLGMTRTEVEAVLGCPADDYRSLETKYDDDVHEFIGDIFNDDGLLIYWESDSGSIGVKLDSSGKVLVAAFEPQQPVARSPLANLLWRAKRQWHRCFPE